MQSDLRAYPTPRKYPMTRRKPFRPYRVALALAYACVLLLHGSMVAAQTASPPVEMTAEEQARYAQAKDHFKRGQKLFDEKAWAPALAEFLEARKIYPTWGTTSYAAHCLQMLMRYDEALELYKALTTDFKDKLPALAKQQAERRIEEMKALVGMIEIEGAEAGAMVVVDLRRRGDYPQVDLVRVSAGTHIVRVYKEGFEPFETRVEVAGRATVRVVAKLTKLEVSGTLSVTEPSGKILEVVVDSIGVGMTPWQGRLPPGKHTVFLRGDDLVGTQPATVTVTRNEVTQLALQSETLAGGLRIEPTPLGATVAIDGVSVGHGLWEGRLRAGMHRIEIADEGFVLYVKELKIEPGAHEVIKVSLDRDPLHPLWKDNRGRVFVEANVGPSIVPTFGGDIAGGCTGTCSSLPGFGVVAQVRGGYRFPSEIMVGVDVGYLYARQSIAGREATIRPAGLPDNPGFVNDALSINGVIFGASGGIKFGKKLPLRVGLAAGVFLGQVRDRRRGEFHTCAGGETTMNKCDPESTSYSVDKAQTYSLTALHVAPEVKLVFPLAKRLELSAGVQGFLLVPIQQRTWQAAKSPVLTGADGQGVFVPDQQHLLGSAVVGVQVGFGARYEF